MYLKSRLLAYVCKKYTFFFQYYFLDVSPYDSGASSLFQIK
jgi:hypothetical protein